MTRRDALVGPTRPSNGERVLAAIQQGLREDLLLGLIVLAFAIVAWLLSALTGYPGTTRWLATYEMLAGFVLLYTVVAIIAAPVRAVVVEKRSLRSVDSWRWMATHLLSPRKLAGFAIAFAALGLLMPTFIAFKRSIPVVHPFSWDPAFMAWDRVLHFGLHPWQWLHPLLSEPWITLLIDRAYLLWIHVMWFTLFWQAWHGSREGVTRSQYLLAFVLSWILLGTVAATLFSSAGPVYFAEVTGRPGPYGPLLEYLHQVGQIYELRALWAHDYLWNAYVAKQAVAVAGISAMPSMHIAIALLQVLLGFSVNRLIGWAYTVFAGVIFLGSIHLAWHYAIDAYASAVGVLVIWWASGRLALWWDGLTSSTDRRRIGA